MGGGEHHRRSLLCWQLLQLCGQLQTAVSRHVDVQQQSIRPGGGDQLPGTGGIACLSDAADFRLLLQLPLQALARERFIIDDDNAQCRLVHVSTCACAGRQSVASKRSSTMRVSRLTVRVNINCKRRRKSLMAVPVP